MYLLILQVDEDACHNIHNRRGRDRMVRSWIYTYLCNQCIASLMLWVHNPAHGV